MTLKKIIALLLTIWLVIDVVEGARQLKLFWGHVSIDAPSFHGGFPSLNKKCALLEQFGLAKCVDVVST